MNKCNIYITRPIPEQTINELRQVHNVEVSPHDRALTREELLAAVRGRDAVITLLTDKIDGEVMDTADPQCKIFANYAVGFDNFDTKARSEEHTSELQSLMRISYAVFCLKKKKQKT